MTTTDYRCTCGRTLAEHEQDEHVVRVPGSGGFMFLADGTNLIVDEDPNPRSLRQLQEQKDRIINEQAATLAKVRMYAEACRDTAHEWLARNPSDLEHAVAGANLATAHGLLRVLDEEPTS